MTTSNTNRIGAGAQNQPSAVSTQQTTQVSSRPFLESINARLQAQGIKVDTNTGMVTNVDLLSTFTNAQWSAIAATLKKLGKTVKSKQDAEIVLETNYGSITGNSNSYAELIQNLEADYIPGIDGGQKTGTTVQLQDPAVIDSIIRGVYQSTLKRDPNAAEFEARRKEVEAVIKQGRTVTKVSDTKTVATPGFTQAGAEAMIKQKIETGDAAVQEDLAQAQSLEFANFIGKLGK